jgi:hypothetical protein
VAWANGSEERSIKGEGLRHALLVAAQVVPTRSGAVQYGANREYDVRNAAACRVKESWKSRAPRRGIGLQTSIAGLDLAGASKISLIR